MVEISPEQQAKINKLNKLLILDFFDGPETIKGREFLKLLKREPVCTNEELQIELEEYYRKREEILNG